MNVEHLRSSLPELGFSGDTAWGDVRAEFAGMRSWYWKGRVHAVEGSVLEADGPPCAVGEVCEIRDSAGVLHAAECIGFRAQRTLLMPLRMAHGVRRGDIVTAHQRRASAWLGAAALGRVLNGVGEPIDGRGPVRFAQRCELMRHPMAALEREPICEPLTTGVRAIDALLTVGRGQRMGIFGGSGVGKSTLIGQMTRGTQAGVTVVALVGERGREVREFLDDSLGEEGRRRSVVVVSTSDESPLMRMRAAQTATAAAEHFADGGKDVLLIVDSLTRYAMAAREVGLAAGEPPMARGYTPSVLTHLAQLVERAGRFQRGSVTAFYTVLMEGDDEQDPVVDAVRSFVDGHILLDRELASAGQFPPISLLRSLSRLMPAITPPEVLAQAASVRRWMAAAARAEDLVRMGAHVAGADPALDEALRRVPFVQRFLAQATGELSDRPAALEALRVLVAPR